MTKRDDLAALANSCVLNHVHFTYAEVRPMQLSRTWPWKGDCSTFVTWCYWMENLPDPNKLGYDGSGNTQTLYAQGQHISLADVQPGDVVVYAADQPLSNQHTAIIVQGGSDPLTVSMGQQGDPSFVHVSQDGRKPFYVRFLPADPVKPTPPQNTSVILPTLAQNAKETALVKTVQALLFSKYKMDIGASGVDGVYGPSTIAAVQKFQLSHSLPASGVVDSATWPVLLKG